MAPSGVKSGVRVETFLLKRNFCQVERCVVYIFFFLPSFLKKKLRGEEEYNRTFLEMSFIMECFLNYLNHKKQWKFFFGIGHISIVKKRRITCLLITDIRCRIKIGRIGFRKKY